LQKSGGVCMFCKCQYCSELDYFSYPTLFSCNAFYRGNCHRICYDTLVYYVGGGHWVLFLKVFFVNSPRLASYCLFCSLHLLQNYGETFLILLWILVGNFSRKLINLNNISARDSFCLIFAAAGVFIKRAWAENVQFYMIYCVKILCNWYTIQKLI
jgi:hypothetical protein